MEKKVVVVGTVGAGYAADLHGRGYAKVNGIQVRLKTVCDLNLELAEKVKEKFGYEQAVTDYADMLADPEIDVIDIVTPPFLHCTMAIQALQAGKHVICEKPLTGYFGKKGEELVGKSVPKSYMYEQILKSMDELKQVVEACGKKFFYAENFVYAAPVQKSAEILRAKKSKILFMKGEESLNGSSSALAGKWSCNGGGTLMRTGCHPLTAMLWLKQQEAKARGEKITVVSVVADCGVATGCLTEEEHQHINIRPEDVEDVGMITVTFSDGTKCLTIATDTVLGGPQNYVEIYANNTALKSNITPTDILDTYFQDEDGLDDVYIAPRMPMKLGWNKAWLCDAEIRGYTGELQDFMETIVNDTEPISDFDLAYETTRVLYAAYQSAEEGSRIDL